MTPEEQRSARGKLALRLFACDVKSLAEGVELLKSLGTDHGKRKLQEAFTQADACIALVKLAPNNPYGSDEEIAQAIVDGIDNKMREIIAKAHSQ